MRWKLQTLNDLSNKVCFPNKMEDINLSMFNMITGINESKRFTKYIPCTCKCKFGERKCNSDQWWNNGKCRCEWKKHHFCQKDYIWNLSTCSCENCNYSASIMVDSAITCDEITDAEAKSNNEEAKTFPTNFNEKNIIKL